MRRDRFWLCLIAIPVCGAFGAWNDGRPTTWEELGGITLGSTLPPKDGSVTIPIIFTNPYWERIASSLPPKVRRVTADVEGSRIYVEVKLMSGLSKKDAPREVTLRPKQGGPYEVFYRDPDGTVHRVGNLTLEAPPRRSRSSSIKR